MQGVHAEERPSVRLEHLTLRSHRTTMFTPAAAAPHRALQIAAALANCAVRGGCKGGSGFCEKRPTSLPALNFAGKKSLAYAAQQHSDFGGLS